MKNKIENLNAGLIKKETSKKETIYAMETILFADIAKKEIKSSPILKYADYLSFLAVENNIPIYASQKMFYGKLSELEKAQDLLLNCAMYN